MGIVDRVKNILLTPKTEWPRIAEEAATVQSIYVGYVVILAAIGPLAIALRMGALGITVAIISYFVGLLVTYLLALIVDALAPSFGSEKNFIQSLKLVAYSYTAAWVGGIFQLIPGIGGIIGLIAAIYSFYTFFLGVGVMKKTPADKAVVYTIVVVISGILLGVVIGGVLFSLFAGGAMGQMGMGME
jgi:hypothetical protein